MLEYLQTSNNSLLQPQHWKSYVHVQSLLTELMESGQSVKVKGIEKDKVTLWEGLCLGQGLDSVHWDNHIFPKPEKLSES